MSAVNTFGEGSYCMTPIYHKCFLFFILVFSPLILVGHDIILIIDYGSPIAHCISSCLQQIQINSFTCWHTQAENTLKTLNPKGIILSGSPNSTLAPDSPRAPEIVFTGGVPVLGICYGQQLMCQQLGGSITRNQEREKGETDLFITGTCALTKNIWQPSSKPVTIWMGHEDRIETLPPGFVNIGYTKHSPYALIADDARKFYGVQFHPEAPHIKEGQKLIHAFALEIAQATPDPLLIPPKDKFIFDVDLYACCGNQ